MALGLELIESDKNSATVRMAFSDLVDNGGRTPHGGAIASLIDNTGAAAAWAGHDFSKGTRGATISLAVNYVGATGDRASIAQAKVVRRAKELVYLTVDVAGESGRAVASALMTYRIGA